MKRLVWKLGPFLKAHELTPYQLETKLRGVLALEEMQQEQAKIKQEGRRITTFSPNTIYSWAKATKPPERPQMITFERILRTLEIMVGREIELEEILAWEEVPNQQGPTAKTPLKKRK